MAYPTHHRQTTQRRTQPVVLPQEAVPAWVHPTSRDYLQHRKITEEEASFYDLSYSDDGPFRQRIIIPVYDSRGSLIAFQGRSLTDEEPRYRTEGLRPIYTPWNEAVDDTLIIVEGPFDLFAVRRVHQSTVASLGNLISARQLENLKRLVQYYKFQRILIWYDAGATIEMYDLQLKLQRFVRTEVFVHPFPEPAKDPGDLSVAQTRKLLIAHDKDEG